MFFQTISENYYSVIPPHGPNYWPTYINRHPNALEYFVTKLTNNLTTIVSNICDLSRDHSPIILSLGDNPV